MRPMGRQLVEVIKDDYTNEVLTEEEAKDVRLTVDSRRYVITLSEKSVTALEKALEPFLNGVEPQADAPAKPASGRRAVKGSGRTDLAAIRAWARENGHEVNDKGRVSTHLQDLYDEAHS